MKIFVTGGFGYLGGCLAQFLASRSNHEIILGSRQAKAEAPHWSPRARVVQTQWDLPGDVEKACSDVDVVVHLAGMNAQDCADDPIAALDTNAVATARLLYAAIRQKAKRFIYLSTAHVYAPTLMRRITEDTCPVNLHPYATSHRAGEDVVRAAHQHGDIEGIVLRLSNTYGAPVHKEANCWMLLVNNLCRQAVTDGKLVLHSAGTQYRDFIALTDTVRAILHFIECPASKLGDGLFNVGGDNPLRIINMAEYISERCYITLGFKPPVQRQQETPLCNILEPLDYRIDKLLKSGFQLKRSIDDEIDATLMFCRTYFEATE